MCLPTELPDKAAVAHSIDSISDMLKVVFSPTIFMYWASALRGMGIFTAVLDGMIQFLFGIMEDRVEHRPQLFL